MEKKNHHIKFLIIYVKMTKMMFLTEDVYKRSKHKSFIIFKFKARYACIL